MSTGIMNTILSDKILAKFKITKLLGTIYIKNIEIINLNKMKK